MCGRFTLTAPSSVIAEHFGLSALPNLSPRYNIAPTQRIAAVRAGAGGAAELVGLRWGLIPAWADDPSIGTRMINARAETVDTKPSFRSAFRHRRCLVPADGYYEWQKTADGKQPYRISMADGGPFAFAGLWEQRERPGEEIIESCTIITTVPSSQLAGIHERMPVILPANVYRLWLDSTYSDVEGLQRLLHPFTAQPMIAVKISTWVNDVGHDGPQCIRELN